MKKWLTEDDPSQLEESADTKKGSSSLPNLSQQLDYFRETCNHEPKLDVDEIELTIRGCDTFVRSHYENGKICKDCLERYYDTFSALCGACLQPILPHSAVLPAAEDALHPWVHANVECVKKLPIQSISDILDKWAVLREDGVKAPNDWS